MIRKICFLLQVAALILAAYGAITTISHPPLRLTPWFRNHPFEQYDFGPEKETDIWQMALQLIGIAMATLAALGALGLILTAFPPLTSEEIQKKKAERNEVRQLAREARIADMIKAAQRREKRQWNAFLIGCALVGITITFSGIIYLNQQAKGTITLSPPIPAWAQDPIVINPQSQ